MPTGWAQGQAAGAQLSWDSAGTAHGVKPQLHSLPDLLTSYSGFFKMKKLKNQILPTTLTVLSSENKAYHPLFFLFVWTVSLQQKM